MAINKVSEITKTRIKEQSVLSLPDKPSEKGYGAQQLKEFFTNIVVGDIGALAEIDRIVVELNRYLDGLENTSIKNYVIDSIVSKFVEQGPFTSLKFEENKLKYTKFGNPTISGELDIIPNNSVFFNSETLENKDGAIIYPKTTLDRIVDTIDDKSIKEFLLGLKTKINTIETNHEIDIKTIEDDLSAIIGGDVDTALDSIKELAEALKNNPSSIDDILQQLSTIRATKVDKVSGKGLSTNDYDNTTKAFVEELKSKDVALKTDIKTKLSELTQDSNYRTVTDSEKNTWNNKAPKTHTHEIKDVNGLESALEGKSDVGHTHTPESIGLDISGLASQVLGSHNTSKDAHQDIRAEITEVKNKVDGINNALSFENLSQLTAWFGGTYNRADGKKPSDLYVGQHIYLKDEDEEDYWVSEIPANIGNLSVLVTDKIDLAEYAQKSELKRVAFTGKHSDLEGIPTIPTTLAELAEDDNHKTISAEKLSKIDTIDTKLDKNLGASQANKMVVTDGLGNVVTAEAGSMAVLVDNLDSTSTTMALAANQGRVLDNKKLDKQLGSENAGKFLKVDEDGIVSLAKVEAEGSVTTEEYLPETPVGTPLDNYYSKTEYSNLEETKFLKEEYGKSASLVDQQTIYSKCSNNNASRIVSGDELIITTNASKHAGIWFKPAEFITMTEGKTYTFSCKIKGTGTSSVRIEHNNGSTGANRADITVTSSYQTVSITFSLVASKAITIYGMDAIAGTLTITDLMLVEGSTALPYQPYSGAIVHQKDILNCQYEKVWSGNIYSANNTFTIPNYNESYVYAIQFMAYSSTYYTIQLLNREPASQYIIEGDANQHCRYRLHREGGTFTINSVDNGTTNTAITAVYRVKGGVV